MAHKTRPVDIVTPVEPCEGGCGKDTAVTVRRDDGARRWSSIRDGRVEPGGHTPDECRFLRGRRNSR